MDRMTYLSDLYVSDLDASTIVIRLLPTWASAMLIVFCRFTLHTEIFHRLQLKLQCKYMLLLFIYMHSLKLVRLFFTQFWFYLRGFSLVGVFLFCNIRPIRRFVFINVINIMRLLCKHDTIIARVSRNSRIPWFSEFPVDFLIPQMQWIAVIFGKFF